MNEIAYFIEDRAMSLSYEGAHFQSIAPEALAWLRLAMAWAKRNGMHCLENRIRAAVQRVEGALVPAQLRRQTLRPRSEHILPRR